MNQSKTWSDFHREAITAGMDDASACHQADQAMEEVEPIRITSISVDERDHLRRFNRDMRACLKDITQLGAVTPIDVPRFYQCCVTAVKLLGEQEVLLCRNNPEK